MSVATARSTDSARPSLRTAVVGAVAGLGAALVGYLVTYVATASTIENATANQVLEALGADIPTWKVVGWVFMNAHGVTTTFPGLFGTTSSVNLVERSAAFSPALYAVPVVALLVAGAAVALVGGAQSASTGAAAGTTAVLGYLPVALVGLVAFALELGDAVARPDPVTAVLLAGLVYPLVCGAVGGAVAGALR